MINLVTIGSVIYLLAFALNDFVFKSLLINENVNFIFLPSGLRIFLVLVFNIYGAISIVIGHLLVALFYLNESNPIFSFGTSLTIAVTSLLARWVSFKLLKLNFDLRAISFHDILVVTIIFSTFTTIGQQMLLHKLALSKNFTSDALLMFTGDVMGALLCLLFAKYVLHVVNYKNSNQ